MHAYEHKEWTQAWGGWGNVWGGERGWGELNEGEKGDIYNILSNKEFLKKKKKLYLLLYQVYFYLTK